MKRYLFVALMLAVCGGSVVAHAATRSSEAQTYVEDARKYLEAGKVRAAIEQLKSALREDPNDVDARFLLGTIYLATQDGQSAEKEFRTAYNQGLENDTLRERLADALLIQGKFQAVLDEIQPEGLDPNQRAVVMSLRGQAFLGLDRLDEARDAFQSAHELSPQLVDAMSGLARVLIQQKKPDEAMELIDQALEEEPDFAGAMILKGELARMSGDFKGAVAQFDKILETKPNYLEALLGRAAALIDLDRDAEAQRDIDRVLELRPQHPLALHLSALVLAKRREFAAADAMLDRAGSTLDEYLPTQFLRGTIAYSRNNLEQAYYFLSRFVDAVPGHANARRLLGSTLLRQGRYEESTRVFDPLLQAGEPDARIYALAGSAYMGTKDYDKAIALYEKAVAADPEQSAYRTQLALVRLTAGQGSEAVADLQSAVEIDPEARQAPVLLARVHLVSKEFDEALAIADQLIEQNPDDPVGYNLRGVALMGKEDMPAAKAAFEKALAVEQDYFPAVQNLAQMEVSAGDVAAAEKRFKEVLSHDRKHEGTMVALSQIALKRGDRAAAIDWLEKASSLNPDSPTAALRLIDLHIQNGDPIQALGTASALEQRIQGNPQVLQALARTQLLAGDPVSATASYTELAKLLPDNAQVYYRLGQTQVSAGDMFGARTSYRKALELNPTLIPAILELINLEVDNNRLRSAMEIATALREAQPEMPMGDLLVGHVQTKMGDNAKALEAFQAAERKINSFDSALRLYYGYKAIDHLDDGYEVLDSWLKRNPDDEQMRRILATAYLEGGEYEKSVEHYQMLHESDGDNPVLLNNLAWLYQNLNDPRAVAVAERAHELLPDAAAVKDTYGWVMVEQGDLQKGATALEQANALAPDEPEIQFHLALARSKQGRDAEACALLQTVLSTDLEFKGREKATVLKDKLQCS